MKRFFSKFVPEAPILVAAALLVTMPSLRGIAAGLATVFPFTVLAAALLLGWRFNRSRLVFAIALLALTEYVLLNGLDTPRDRMYFHALAFLLPVSWTIAKAGDDKGAEGDKKEKKGKKGKKGDGEGGDKKDEKKDDKKM